jgi:hypothetical protein
MIIDAFNHIYPTKYLEASYIYKEMAERYGRAEGRLKGD